MQERKSLITALTETRKACKEEKRKREESENICRDEIKKARQVAFLDLFIFF